MARPIDSELRRDLLDRVVTYLAEHGLAQATLRPMAATLNVSLNRLVHHFGSKEALLSAALERAVERQLDVQASWFERRPDLTVVELYRKWWRWLNESPSNLGLARLGYEAAVVDPAVSGVPSDVRADQIGVWRSVVEQRLVREGLAPKVAASEAALIKAMFTGLVMDLFASGDRRRLNAVCEAWLSGLVDRLAALEPASA